MRTTHHPEIVRTPGEFNPAFAGKVRGYPRTEETYRKQLERLRNNSKKAREAGRLNRRGVPNGWGKRKAEITALRSAAAAKAAKAASAALPNYQAEGAGLDPWSMTDEQLGDEALRLGLELVFDTTQTIATRLSAMRMVLPFLLPAPTRRTVSTFNLGLSWLEGLSSEPEGD